MDLKIAYKEQLLQQIQEVVSSVEYTLPLYDIIINSQGASPLDIIIILGEYKIPHVTDKRAFLIKQDEKINTLFKKKHSVSIFAAPHPADYDWRFTEETILFLFNNIKSLLKEDKKIALFGAQTLFPVCKQNGLKVFLFNKSKSIINDLNKAGFDDGLLEVDLFNSLSAYNSTFKIVVSDPPWYLEHYEAFINRSSDLLELNGYLLISILPKLTRPLAISDRLYIKNIAEKAGFEFIRADEGSLFYETPYFEEQSLLENGVCCDNWRVGDLWIFKKIKTVIKHNDIINSITDPEWFEYRIENRRVKLRKGSISNDKIFTFENSDNSKILSSVSRRSLVRNRIDVWTSDNVAFKVTRANLLKECFYLLENSSFESVLTFLNKDESITFKEYEDILTLLHEIT